MALANKTKYAILGALSLMPMSGYDIKKFFDGSVAHFWNENYARIYPTLKEMEKEELVTGETTQSKNRPIKNVYTITAKGRDELHRWLFQPPEERRLREELLLQLFFAENIPVESLLSKIDAEKQKNLRYLEEYEHIEHFLRTDETTRNERGLPLWLATLNFGKYFREAVIKWCDETAESLKIMDKRQSKTGIIEPIERRSKCRANR